MKLKTRLIVAFFVIILVPFFLFYLAFLGFTGYQIQTMEKRYGVTMDLEDLSDSLQIIGRSTQEIFGRLKAQAEQDPERFLDRVYLASVNQDLAEMSSWVLVRVDGALYYDGSGMDDINARVLLPALPEFRGFVSADDGGSYIGGKVQAFVKQMDIGFPGGRQGTVFVISSAGRFLSHTRALVRDLLLTVIVILVFTATILILWIYAGINTPLKKLREATNRIKNEDFEFEIEAEGKDEISELCRDFDDMRKKLKEQAEEKDAFDRQSKELISNISHDLKTPITAVKGYVEGIMDGVADTPEKMDRYIRTIYIKANDMDRLINELTFYSKIDTNRIPYTFNRIDVAEYFDDCAEEVGLELRERNIEFSYINHVEPQVQIIADAEQLKRVINNIIGNSVKYMDKSHGKIQIRVKDVGDFIQAEIEDNGKGIQAKDLGNIFERFYRTDASRNSSQGGSGIGLSIVKKIIEDHGGRIWANSKVGKGTTMCFVIRKYQVNVEDRS